jgi:hypothetical protein
MTLKDFVIKVTGRPYISEVELDDYYEEFFEYFASEMPYGVAKARTGDPDQWMFDRLEEEGLIKVE